MAFWDKWFRRGDDEGEDVPIELDVDARRRQLHELEQSLDALVRGLREHPRLSANPGWQARTAEYDRLAGQAMMLRQRVPTREELLDLAFEVRPVFNAEVPEGLDDLVPLQDAVLQRTQALVDVLPGER
ncbi:hypothetical protein [Desertihabitans aurantiacus]|uniref:hypothetical protein n=1 Tax=Desertihabitans aurantiacus TaxID=2282477 RepID=UPI000DF789DE|nr:hypothetical protein [Desertihabitans aurantiacus]